MLNNIISVDDVIKLHNLLVEEFGGSKGIRDMGMLISSINSPFQTFDNKFIYQTPEKRAARLCGNLIKNHPFIDGNKRIGVATMLAYLHMEGIILVASDEDILDLGLSVARDLSFEEIENFINKHKK